MEVHLLEAALDEVKEEFVLRVQGLRQMVPGPASAGSWTCINVTQQHHTTEVHNNQPPLRRDTGRTT